MHFYNGSTLDNRRSVLQTGASVADIVCEDSLLEFVAGEIDSSQFYSEPDLMAWINTGHSITSGTLVLYHFSAALPAWVRHGGEGQRCVP